jgi:ATP-dependent exoDNAse (exonuclease V) beta subunit
MFIHSSSFAPIELEAIMVDGRRLYPTPSGGKYPSITTVLGVCPKKKASLAKWKQRVGQDKAQAISTRAATRGTDFHKMVENLLNNCYNDDDFKGKHLPLLMFKNAVPTLNRITKVYLQEAALYSDHLEIAGRVDCIGEFDGIPSIIDFKTSKEEKKEDWMEDYYIQETAYGCMFYELYNTRIKQLVTIVACEDGHTQVVIKKPERKYLDRLIELRSLYQEIYGG